MKNYTFFITISFVLLTFSCSNEKKEWKEARMLDSIPIYKEFLINFPKGSYADSAKILIEGRQIAVYSIPEGLNIYLGVPNESVLTKNISIPPIPNDLVNPMIAYPPSAVLHMSKPISVSCPP